MQLTRTLLARTRWRGCARAGCRPPWTRIGADQGEPRKPPIDEMMTIEPSLRASIWGATKWISQWLARRCSRGSCGTGSSDARHRPEIGVGRRVADQDVDLPEQAHGLVDQPLKPVLRCDVGRDRDRAARAVLGVDLLGDLFAGPGLARGDHDVRAMLGHALGNRLTDDVDEPVIMAALPASENNDMGMLIFAI